MKIIEDRGACSCCGVVSDYCYGDEDFSISTKDLVNYLKYKDIYVYKCQFCDFISTDLVGVEGVLYGKVRNSLEYKNALNYEYLNGLDKELYENHSESIPANLFEAYSFVCLEDKDYEKFIRTLNKAIELKEVMARKYRLSEYELGGEEENDDQYDLLDKLIKESIESNAKQIDFYYTQLDHKNLFVSLIYIENLTRLDKKEKAQNLFNKLTKSFTLKSDLKNYMEEKFK